MPSNVVIEKADDASIKKTNKDSKHHQEEENNVIVPEEPPIPLSYIKYHMKKGGGLGGKLTGIKENEDKEKVYFEPLSYRKLIRIIS